MKQIFVAVNHVNWEYPALVETWKEFGKVTHFANTTGFDQWDDQWLLAGKKQFNRALVETVEQRHRQKPIDLFFSYLSGRWLYPETIKSIRKLKIPTVNISFDDTVAFRGLKDKEGWCGNASIARHFDLCVTCQNRRDLWKYKFAGARALFMPPGAPEDLTLIERASTPRNVVCFVGQKYGVRAEIMEKLRASFPDETYGKGWKSGELSRQDMKSIYSQVSINVGFGFIGDSRRLVGLKGRDFEVTATGGFYLTSFHPQLAECFEEGKDIEFYRSFGELERKIAFYLLHPEKAATIGRAAQIKVRQHHLWSHRFKQILSEVESIR